jgi:transcriptional regulator with XRE-family HTH domain
MPRARNPTRPGPVDIAIGRNVRIWRMARRLSQAELGDRLGITFQQLQKYEVGVNRISIGWLVKIAQVLRLPLQELLAGVENRGEATLLVLVSDPRAMRLAQCFSTITNANLRLALVQLVERIAESVPQGPPRRRGRPLK